MKRKRIKTKARRRLVLPPEHYEEEQVCNCGSCRFCLDPVYREQLIGTRSPMQYRRVYGHRYKGPAQPWAHEKYSLNMATMTMIKKVGRTSKAKGKASGQIYLPAQWAGKTVRVELLVDKKPSG